MQVEAGRAGGVKERRRVVGRAKNTLCLRVSVVKKLQVRYGIPKLCHTLCFLNTNLKVGIKEG